MCLTGTFALWLVLPEFECAKGETYPALALVYITLVCKFYQHLALYPGGTLLFAMGIQILGGWGGI